MVPGYTVLEEIGRGGMGVVYRALQHSLNREVAIKMILGGQHADSDAFLRFQVEVEAIGKLQHPNIVQVYEVGEHDGTPYFVMEFMKDGSLAAKTGNEPHEPDIAARLVAVLARSVQAVHAQGIVHRDLKPGNILLQGCSENAKSLGTPKITDFGLAKHVQENSGLTQSGEILGTPSYMAPEQASGSNQLIGPAADVYSLGAILYELLTGKPPFGQFASLDALIQIINTPPAMPRTRVGSIPRDLETICLKCLEKKPTDRYASAHELAEDLERFLAKEPVKARPLSSAGRVVRWVKRHPITTFLSMAFVIAVLVGLVTSFVLYRQADGHAREAQQNFLTARASERKAKAKSNQLAQKEKLLQEKRTLLLRQQDETRRQVVRLLDHKVAHLLETGNYLKAYDVLLEAREKSQDLSSSANVMRADKQRRLLATTILGRCPRLVREDSLPRQDDFPESVYNLGVYDPPWLGMLTDERLLKKILSPDANQWPRATHKLAELSPNERWSIRRETNATSYLFRLQDKRSGRVWEVVKVPRWKGATKPKHQHDPNSLWQLFVAFDSASTHLFIGAGYKDMSFDGTVWNLEGEEPTSQKYHLDKVDLGPTAFSGFYPQHKTIVFWIGLLDQTCLVNYDTGEQKLLPPGYRVSFGQVHDRRLLVFSQRPSVGLWKFGTNKLEASPLEWGGAVSAAGFDHTGDRLAVGGGDGTARIVRCLPQRGHDRQGSSEQAEVLGGVFRHRGRITGLDFSPDDRWILTGSEDRTARLWDAKRSIPLSPFFLPHKSRITHARFAGDGRRVVTISFHRRYRVWDLAGAYTPNTRWFHAKGALCVEFSPDGRFVASGGKDGVVHIWDRKKGEPACPPLVHAHPITNVSWNHDSTLVVTSGDFWSLGQDHPSVVCVWDRATGQLHYGPLARSGGSTGFAYGTTDFRPGTNQLLIGYDHDFNFHDMDARRDLAVAPFRPPERCLIDEQKMTSDGKFLVRWYSDCSRLFDVLSLPDCKLVFGQSMEKEAPRSSQVALRFDGRQFASVHAGTLATWTLASSVAKPSRFSDDLSESKRPENTKVRLHRKKQIGDVNLLPSGLFYSCDGRWLTVVLGHEGLVQVFDSETLKQCGVNVEVNGEVVYAKVDPSRECLITVRRDGTMRLWDWESGLPVTPEYYHGAPVTDVELSPDQQYLAVAGRKGMVRLWKLPNTPTTWTDLPERKDLPTPQGPTDLDTQRLWHEEQVDLSRREGDDTAMAHHLAILLNNSNNAPLWKRFRWRYQTAQVAFRQKKWEIASNEAKRLRSELAGNPEVPRSFLDFHDYDLDALEARCLAKAGKHSESLDRYLRLCRTHPKQSEFALGAARVALELDKQDVARKLFRQVITHHPRFDLETLATGVKRTKQTVDDPRLAYHCRNQWEPLLGEWHDIDVPDTAKDEGRLGRALILASVLRWEEVEAELAPLLKKIKAFSGRVSSDRSSEKLRGELALHIGALAAFAKGDLRTGRQRLRKAIQVAPKNLRLGFLEVNMTYFPIPANDARNTKWVQKAKAILDKVIEAPSPPAKAFSLRGIVRSSLGDLSGAVQDYEVLRARNALRLPFEWFLYSRTMALAKDWKKAAAGFQEVMKTDSRNIAFVQRSIYASTKAGDAKGALATLEQQLKRNPRSLQESQIHDLLWTAVVVGAPTKWLAPWEGQLERIVQKHSNPGWINTLGWLYARQNKTEKARETIQRAMQPSGGQWWDHLALVTIEHQAGNLEKAREHLQTARAAFLRSISGQGVSWTTRVEAELLLAEMETLIEGKTKAE